MWVSADNTFQLTDSWVHGYWQWSLQTWKVHIDLHGIQHLYWKMPPVLPKWQVSVNPIPQGGRRVCLLWSWIQNLNNIRPSRFKQRGREWFTPKVCIHDWVESAFIDASRGSSRRKGLGTTTTIIWQYFTWEVPTSETAACTEGRAVVLAGIL